MKQSPNLVKDNLIASKEQNVRRHNKKKNTVHLEQVGDTVLVQLGKINFPKLTISLPPKSKGQKFPRQIKELGES